MKILIVIMIATLELSASLWDFSYLNDAKKAYESKEYDKAEKLYQKIESDEAKFNRADALYRQKKYQKALEEYESISDTKLTFKKLHNIGNSQAQLGKIDEAIKSYEEALGIKNDEDTKFNLELLKKKKEEQKKQKQKNKDNQKKDNQKNQNQKSKNQENNESKTGQKNKNQQENNSSKEQKDKASKAQKEKKKEADKKAQEAKKKEKEDKKKEEQQKQAAQMLEQNQTQPPISNMEERKWQKMLNQRGVNTLMLPLNNKGEQHNETNPW